MREALRAFLCVNKATQVPPPWKLEDLAWEYWPFLESIVLILTLFSKPSGLPLFDILL